MSYNQPTRIENINIYQGTDYVGLVNMNAETIGQPCTSTTPVNISGSSFTGQIIKDFHCQDVLATFTCSVVNASAGQFQINIPAANTTNISTHAFNNALVFQAMIGLYTINWYNPITATTTCLVYGQVYMIRNTNVTQPTCSS